jgi:hypothetical protein
MNVICFLLTWMLIVSSIWTFTSNLKAGIIQLKKLHQVPCSKCQYFTNSYYLKCTINPQIAGSELAIDCHDYQVQV